MSTKYVEINRHLEALEGYTEIEVDKFEDLAELEKQTTTGNRYLCKYTLRWDERDLDLQVTNYVFLPDENLVFHSTKILADEATIEAFNIHQEELEKMGEKMAEFLGQKTDKEISIQKAVEEKTKEYALDVSKNINLSNSAAINETAEIFLERLMKELNYPEDETSQTRVHIINALNKHQEEITKQRKLVKEAKMKELINELITDEEYLELFKQEARAKLILDRAESKKVYLTKKEDVPWIIEKVRIRRGEK